jgi:6-phosphogluconolactonase (cycloisomerase 2 family)/uncharacterized protein YjdB
VLAALAGWFAYGCGGGGVNMSADCGFGAPGNLNGKTSVAVGAEVQLSVPPSCLSSGESVSWTASPTGYLSVDNNGNVTGLSATPPDITVTVTAAYTDGSGAANLTVTGPTLQSIAVTDVDNGAATVGEGDVFTATGTYSDTSTQNLTNYVSWVSSVPTVADIATAPSSGPGGDPGDAGTLAPGNTLISASVTIGSAPAITGLEVLTVGTLNSITVTDADNGVAPPSSTDQFAATASYAGGTTQNVTTMVTWTSGNTAVASFAVNGVTPPGLAVTGINGTALITATLTAGTSTPVKGTETLTVAGTPPTLVSIAVTPTTASIATGQTQPYTATGTYSSGPTQVLTTGVTWASSNTGTATINSTGLATGVAAGTTNITATVGTVSSPPTAVTLTVTASPVLQSIAVTPATASVVAGLTQQYTATGTYSSGPTQVLTTGVTWASSNTSAATIDGSGLATGVAAGTTNITATVGTVSSPPTAVTLTVTAPVLQSITVTPSTASIQVGQTQDYIATGSYSNHTTAPITTGVTWTSNPTAIATINGSGVATGVSKGTATIMATVGTISSPTVNLTVIPATGVSVSRYLVELSTSGISVDAIVPGSGQLRASNISLIPNASTLYPQGLLVNPDGQSIYLAAGLSGSGAEVAQYSISASGMLTAGTSVTNTNWNSTAVMDPLGRFIYVTDFSGDFWAIPLDSSGAPGTAVEALAGGGNFALMAIDPTGTYLFSQSQNGLNIASYKIGSSGTLTSIGTTAGPIQPQSLTVTPSGNVLYAMNVYGQINAYSISAGVLTELANSPFNVSSNGSPEQLTIDPSGSFLYVTEESTDGLFGFTIASDGSLTAMQSGTSFSVGQSPNYINVDAGSHFLYVSNRSSSDIWVYSITSGTGLVTKASEIRTSAYTGQAMVSGTAGLTFTPTALFVANEATPSATITQFTIDSATGNLTPLSTPIGAGDAPKTVATDPFGLYAYDAAFDSDAVFGYTISSAGLNLLPSEPYPAGNGPSWLITDLSGSFLYATMETDNSIWKYDLVGGVPTSGAKTVSTFGTGPVFIASEPTGRYFYVANTTTPSIDMYAIDLPGGSLVANGGGTLAKGNSQTSIAVDPSGQFAYSADPLGNAVWEYTIGTTGVLSLNTTPFQSVGASAAEPGAGSVVVEPTGKYLYATNISLGQIYAFSIDPSSGLLSLVHTSMTDSEVADPGLSPGELAVDISGKYLYCVTTPTAGSGTISIYSIDPSTGLLTSIGAVTNVPFAAGFTLTGTMQ